MTRNRLIPYHSPTTGHTPVISSMSAGELALNEVDGLLFFKGKTSGGADELKTVNPISTNAVAGLLRLATDVEASYMTDGTVALSPLSLYNGFNANRSTIGSSKLAQFFPGGLGFQCGATSNSFTGGSYIGITYQTAYQSLSVYGVGVTVISGVGSGGVSSPAILSAINISSSTLRIQNMTTSSFTGLYFSWYSWGIV